VLIGYPGDTMGAAESRLHSVLSLGVLPMAMLWRDKGGKTDPCWRRFQRIWARPRLIFHKCRIETVASEWIDDFAGDLETAEGIGVAEVEATMEEI